MPSPANSIRKPSLRKKEARPPTVRVGARESDNTLYTRVKETVSRANGWLKETTLDAYALDEVALLLPDSQAGDEWFAQMLYRVGNRGITYFNRSEDVVECLPLPSRYSVRYDFFSTELGVRLELLRMKDGFSPLHNLYDIHDRGRDAAIVHASFKVPNGLEYEETCSILRAHGWDLGQSCSSTYGEFSYWRKQGDEGSLLWLKPRVNLRDAVGPVLPSSEEQMEAFDDEKFMDDEDGVEEFL
jgi:hypothetical protein